MNHPSTSGERAGGGEIVDFDQVLLHACPPEQLTELTIEAALLARAFAPDGRSTPIAALARAVESGSRNLESGRARARLLAAALRRIAREAERQED